MRGCLFLAGLAAALTTGGCHLGLLMVAAGTADQGPYHAETLAKELGPTSVRTMGCLDVGLALSEREDGAKLLDVHVGNRCAHPEALDFQRVTIRALDAQGESRTVKLSDPHNQIVRLSVGGAERGRERLKLLDADRLTRLCFDLEAIAPDAPEARPAPVCFEAAAGWTPTFKGGLT